MPSSNDKAITILLVVVGCLVLLPLLIPIGGHLFGLFHVPFFEHTSLRGIPFVPLFITFPLILVVIWIAIVVWVYRDAENRGMSGVLWALLVFFGNIVALIIYLIIRNDAGGTRIQFENRRICSGCGQSIAQSYAFCPHCGIQLQANCPSCHKPISSDWIVCPHCGSHLDDKAKRVFQDN
ncbi:zinc ribbon domain-containing protein [candidate division KSB1 bacterium]|nr:zinc ribbon domain-containing protein [candidate division KSB1 bacterium]